MYYEVKATLAPSSDMEMITIRFKVSDDKAAIKAMEVALKQLGFLECEYLINWAHKIG